MDSEIIILMTACPTSSFLENRIGAYDCKCSRSSSSSAHHSPLLDIIISAERRPLLDIGLPQSSPRRSVLCCPRPATSRDLHQIVGQPCGGPTNAASPCTRSLFEDLSAPTAVSLPRNVPCPLPLEVCNSSGYVGDLSSFTDLVISDSIT
jgi:hypothetical protein